jgi:regulatory protein
MLVTRVRPDPRAPDCVVVDVDGARFACVPAEEANRLGIEQGIALDEERRERLAYLADVEGARRVALRMLGTRPRSVQEMLRKLRQRGLHPSAVAEVVGRLEEQRLLNDREFAEHFARVRSAKGHGRARLVTDLLARGVDRRVAESAIDRALDAEGVDEMVAARALAEKRMAQLGNLPRDALFRRVVAYLGRRGYRGRDVLDAVQEILGAK